jgi:hypothetical protein
MAETLGSLCDKLTIVKLKQYHSEDPERLRSLESQQRQLQSEIDQFVWDAFDGRIPSERLSFASNKVFKREGNAVADVRGSVGEVFSQLADVNCRLWHEQEKVYEFEKVLPQAKDAVVKQLALLNLERNKCIDQIDRQLREAVERTQGSLGGELSATRGPLHVLKSDQELQREPDTELSRSGL